MKQLVVLCLLACLVPTSANLWCSGCQSVIQELEKVGDDCSEACNFFNGTSNLVCNWIIQQVSCQTLVSWVTSGKDPHAICQNIGLCSNNTKCDCGVCTSFATDRCLSLPNICPNNAADVYQPFEEKKVAAQPTQGGWCVDGQCSAEHYGCCLTCWDGPKVKQSKP